MGNYHPKEAAVRCKSWSLDAQLTVSSSWGAFGFSLVTAVPCAPVLVAF